MMNVMPPVFRFFRRFAFKTQPADAPVDPSDAFSFNKRGVQRVHAGLREEARADFEAAIRCDASHAPALMNLGNLAFESGDPLEAIRWYEAAIAADPAYPLVHANLASAYKKLGRYGDAVRAMREARKREVRPGRKPSTRT